MVARIVDRGLGSAALSDVTRASFAIALIGLAAAGCIGDGEPACTHEYCEIGERRCVEQASAVVACQRGQPEVFPFVRYRTAEEVVAELETTSEAPTDEDEQQLALLALFGLMPEDYEPAQVTADRVSNITAYYDDRTGFITIVTDNVSKDPVAAYSVLVHELVHLYQDRQHDLEALKDQHAWTLTRALGLRALIEGEAELEEDLAYLALEQIKPARVSWDEYFDDYQTAMLDLAAESSTPWVDVWTLFPYAWGEAYVHREWWAGGREAIDRLYETPPQSVRAAMMGHSVVNEDDILDPRAIPVLPSDYTALGAGHYSVWLVNACLQRTADSGLWNAAVDSITADVLSGFWHEPTQSAVGVWRLRTSSPEALASVLATGWTPWGSSSSTPTQRLMVQVDGDLVLVATTEALDAGQVYALVDEWQSIEEAFASPGEASGRWGRPWPERRWPEHRRYASPPPRR